MGWSSGLLAVVCLVLVIPGQHGQDTCVGIDGRPGVPGAQGREGLRGPKGQKGEPAIAANLPLDRADLLKLKGENGARGVPGEMGPKGYGGELGPEGVVGPPGPPGFTRGQLQGSADNQLQHGQVAFSVVRTDTSYPSYVQPVIFQTAIVNQPGNFDLRTGRFTCKKAGIYYFVFHATSTVSMCLRLRSEAVSELQLGFCDYNSRGQSQVLSGGAVLQLTQGQKVWLEAFRDAQPDEVTRDTAGKSIIFNGFLLFQTS